MEIGLQSQMLREAIQHGVVPDQIASREAVYLNSVNERSQASHHELINLAQDDRTARMIEHSFPTINPGRGPEDPVIWDAGDFYELARLVIPHGHFAFLRRIETAWILAQSGNPVNIWGSPAVAENLGDVYFHLRIEPLRNAVLGDRLLGAIAPWPLPIMGFLPGTPWHEMAPWMDYRFAWGAVDDSVQIPIRQDSVLRLFVVYQSSPLIPGAHEFGGRLRASIQSMDSVSAKWMSARQWTSS